MGLGARDTLRLEARMPLYGNDIDEDTTPLEAGLGRFVKLHKEFTGRDVLLKQKEEGLQRKLVAFTMLDRGFPARVTPAQPGWGRDWGRDQRHPLAEFGLSHRDGLCTDRSGQTGYGNPSADQE